METSIKSYAKKKCLAVRQNDALTTCKEINPWTSQRSFKGGGMFSPPAKE